MTRNLVPPVLFLSLAVLGWGVTGWPAEPTGSVGGVLGLAALCVAGVLISPARDDDR